MSKLDKIIERAVEKAFGEDSQASTSSGHMGTKIVVLQRGWVMVGDYYRDGDECTLSNSKVIRRWGTTKGLGELAKNGPTNDTILDDAGTTRFNRGAEVLAIDCEGAKWLKN